MSTRKRKSPKGKGKRRQPGLVSQGASAVGALGLRGAGALGVFGVRGAGALGGLIGRYPSVAGGTMAFVVVFSFVAANALWYQPGRHPSPLLRTRDAAASNAIAGRRAYFPLRSDAGNVTTFRIERPDDAEALPAASPAPGAPPSAAPAAAAPAAKAASLKPPVRPGAAVPAERPHEDLSSQQANADPVAAAILNAEKTVKPGGPIPPKPIGGDAVSSVNLVMQIQKGLSNIAYSDVSIDGVAGDQTRAAIRRFQKHYQLPQTGQPDIAVLKKLRDIGAL